MNPQEGEPIDSPRGRLDAQSSNVIVRFLVTVCGISALAFMPALTGFTSFGDGIAALASYCSFVSLFWVFVASRRRAIPGAASLNEWDECLGLTGVSALAHLSHHFLNG
jgi:hypothetical protein